MDGTMRATSGWRVDYFQRTENDPFERFGSQRWQDAGKRRAVRRLGAFRMERRGSGSKSIDGTLSTSGGKPTAAASGAAGSAVSTGADSSATGAGAATGESVGVANVVPFWNSRSEQAGVKRRRRPKRTASVSSSIPGAATVAGTSGAATSRRLRNASAPFRAQEPRSRRSSGAGTTESRISRSVATSERDGAKRVPKLWSTF